MNIKSFDYRPFPRVVWLNDNVNIFMNDVWWKMFYILKPWAAMHWWFKLRKIAKKHGCLIDTKFEIGTNIEYRKICSFSTWDD